MKLKYVKNHPANAGSISVPSKLRLPIRLKVGCQFAFHRLTPVVCAFDVIKPVIGAFIISFLCVFPAFAQVDILKENFFSFPIDLVYAWVDGSDEKWAQKKEYWLSKQKEKTNFSSGAARWRDRGELKYSLRSVAKYMPWVNKIYIITDEQVPSWLNTDHPKIKIIDHKDIFPLEALPVFNSNAIETRLPYIKDLSEHFIYANDDVFASKPLRVDFFFMPDGKAVFYNDFNRAKFDEERLKEGENVFFDTIKNGYRFIDEVLKIKMPFRLHDMHTFTSYIKSDFLEVNEKFEKEIQPTTYSKFRSKTDLRREYVTAYSYLKSHLVVKDITDVKEHFCEKAGVLITFNPSFLQKSNSCTFCLNDSSNMPEDITQKQLELMENLFPLKSEFEK